MSILAQNILGYCPEYVDSDAHGLGACDLLLRYLCGVAHKVRKNFPRGMMEGEEFTCSGRQLSAQELMGRQ